MPRGLIRAPSIVEPTISAPADYIRASAENSVGHGRLWLRFAIRGNRDQSAVLAANLLHRVTFEPELEGEKRSRDEFFITSRAVRFYGASRR